MSEKAALKAPAAPAKDKKADSKDKVAGVVKKQEAHRVEKVEWTLERVLKYARRFPTEAHWATGSPASYKSALAHGWVAQCVAEIQKYAAGGKVLSGNFGKGNDRAGASHKKAA